MKQDTPISAPSGFTPAYAVGFADSNLNYRLVSEDVRLPVTTSRPAPQPLSGEVTTSGMIGPFEATAGRVVSVALDGEWTGKVRVLRASEPGGTAMPLKIGGLPWGEFAGSGIEQVWSESEDGAAYYLDIALTSGTVAYRVSQ